MQQMIKNFLWMGLLTLGLPSAYAFSLLGPTGNGGDAWQVPAIGWGVNIDIGDVGSAKNLGEEYRRNTPVIYYTYDANFLNYFGSNGVVAVDNAVAIMNALSNVDDYDYTDMSEVSQFPFDTREYNGTAGAENLMDLKSTALFTIVEQMGLANPVRYTWALHDRTILTGPEYTNPCPAGIVYTIVQRNFDPITWRPTNVVDNATYGYIIAEGCGMGTIPADAEETPYTGSPVAEGLGLQPSLSVGDEAFGIFFTGLTWDDVGGLRYLYTSNNVNFEDLPPGTFAETINSNTPTLLTTSNLNSLVSAALTSDPATMQTLFPGLELASTNYYFSNVVAPVITAYLTNYVKAPADAPPTLIVTSVLTTNIEQFYQYSFANVVTNSYYTSAVVTNETIKTIQNAEGDFILQTNYTKITTNLVTGDYYIMPSGSCPPDFLQTLQTNLVTVTNTVFSTNLVAADGIPYFYSQSLIFRYTNHVFVVAPCTLQTNASALYQGIEKVQFVRADFDSLLGQFFAPITNTYTMNLVTNSQVVPQTLQRIVTAPDILFSAADLATGPAAGPFTELNPFLSRTINFDQNNIGAGLAGPGTITAPSTITFNKVGNIFENGGSEDTNAIYGDTNQFLLEYVWGSFNSVSSSNIVVYPNGTDIQNLENQALIQITPSSPLPDGTSGAAYSATTFTTTGGAFTPPFTWSAPGGLPSGMTLSSGGTLSGTPTLAGTYDFVIQMTDTNARSVQWIYEVTIN
jgi:hypothetical protein